LKFIKNAKIILKDRIVEGKALAYDEKISGVVSADSIPADAEVIDAKGAYVAPGFIDIHIHGYLGEDASDGKAEGIRKMAEGIVKNGVTGWLPTTMTVSVAELTKAFDTIGALKEESKGWNGATILGVNAEGPYINASKKGAQAEEHILTPTADFFKKYGDLIKIATMAPEQDADYAAIRELKEKTGILISMGHTGATFEQAMEATANGVGHVTHLFNAQTPLTHRAPGVVGAALTADVSVELICDTFHIHSGLFSLIAKVKGDKLCLITDCIRAGGMEDGDYTLGGQPVHKEGIKCLMPDGTIAGSVLTLNKAVYNLWTNAGIEVWEAVNCASLNPATALGEESEIGSLEVGKRADIIIADDKFDINTTILAGQVRYNA